MLKASFLLATTCLFSFLSRGSTFTSRSTMRVRRKEVVECGVTIDNNFAETPVDEVDHDMVQRNLRFSGVGRLYTDVEDITELDSDQQHLKVVDKLSSSKVIVVGLGGVGSWAAEALCRSGIGNLVLVDLDDICISNTNRQLHAMSTTVGRMKIDEMKDRIQKINPRCNVTLIHDFISTDNVNSILDSLSDATACLDAIDTTRAKSALLNACVERALPVITCGGSAGRRDPTKIVCADLTQVKGDRLLATCRRDLRKLYGFPEGRSHSEITSKNGKPPRKWNMPSVYSTEVAKAVPSDSNGSSLRRCDGALGTACFVTGTFGFVAAAAIVEGIANDQLKVPRRLRHNPTDIPTT